MHVDVDLLGEINTNSRPSRAWEGYITKIKWLQLSKEIEFK
jgi:hypothetical protein